MKTVRLALAALAAGATLAAVADAASARSIRAPGPVKALSVTGFEVAFAAAYRPGCIELRVWHTADRGVRRYARHCFVSTSTGSGVSHVAVSRGRALWITYTGGNVREYSLWTRTRTSRVRRLQFVAADVDAPPPLVVGTADEEALLYAVRRTVVALAPSGARVFAWGAPADVRFLTAQGERHAAVLADGRVYTLGANGAARLEKTHEPASLTAAVWTATELLVHVRGAVGPHRVARDAAYEGFAGGLYAYTSGSDLRLVRVRDGRDVRFARVDAPALAGFDRLGIAYASSRTVTFTSRAVVQAAVAAG